ncbi:phospholipase D-like domain-containing protein [Streptomyces sannanensis]|uniref:phospholipase D-like domain-containing protein n=1 Tax=Streptomyces sannanensis TaxID=285536 RepID=UPI0031EE3858
MLFAGAGTATAVDTPIVTGAVFNNPKGTTDEKNAVKNHIIDAINKTQSGRLIRAAMYALTDEDYTNALIAAYNKGVNVRVVLDGKYVTTGSTADDLRNVLGTDTSKSSWVTVCGTGTDDLACIGTGNNALNHNKFFLFSRVGGVVGEGEDVVIQASANQTSANTQKYFNNAYTVVGNTALYTAYVGYFNDLAAQVKNSNYYKTGYADSLKYYFFPQGSGDVMADFVNNVSCTGNSTVGTANGHKSIIRVAASMFFNRPAVRDALVARANEGCSVQIVYAEADASYVSTLKRHANITLKQLYDLNTDGTVKYQVHSKYLLVEGNYAGHPDTYWTFMGSHNLDLSSLRENDEALLRIDGATAHNAYAANFATLLANASSPS